MLESAIVTGGAGGGSPSERLQRSEAVGWDEPEAGPVTIWYENLHYYP